MKRFGLFGSALVLSALGICACNGDDNGATPEVDAETPGVDASIPGEAGTGEDGGIPVESGTEAGPVVTDGGDGGDASGPSYALFVGTDFVSSELAVVNLHPDSVAGRLPLADQDSVPYASSGAGFVLEDTVGKVIVLDHAQPWMATSTIDINDTPDAGPSASNPHAIVLTTGSKAYVARYASNVLKIIDVASGTVTGSLDLSAFVAPDDPDGLVDVQDAAFDATSGRAYFLLQGIDQTGTGSIPPDYVGPCLASGGEIVGVNVSDDSIVDLNGAAAGTAIALLGADPESLTPDFAHGRLIVPDTGCYQVPATDAGDAGTPARLQRGVESVALATGTSAWLYQTSEIDRLQGLVWVDGTHAFVNEGSNWLAWNPTQTTLGDVVANFPQGPVYDGAGRIVGLSFTTPDAGSDAGIVWSVVAMDVATSQISTIASNPFQSVVPDTGGYGISGAFLP